MQYKTKSLEYINAVEFAELATLAETCVSPNSLSRKALSAAKVIDCVIGEAGWLIEDKFSRSQIMLLLQDLAGSVRAATQACKVSTQKELVSTREVLRIDALSARQLLRDVISSGVKTLNSQVRTVRAKHPSKNATFSEFGWFDDDADEDDQSG
ncbi:hypothetical protein PHMEG_00017351 [Phytophthora megakarya]|uniref:Uncharacterized protein n=1 Tax=Phytophthora megakarya TaxID=4795 RepID=A0A225VY52_9STRA|nr:hypothetical protein PHMEG_00017351 [Phytophthora megakarya]